MNANNQIVKKTKTFINNLAHSEIILQAILVGLISGLMVVLFKVCIGEVFDFIQLHISPLPLYKKILIFPMITTIGGLISGLLVFKIAPETQGSGIPYVKMTLARIGKGTRIRSILVKFFAGVAGIGTGLSLGREGPSVQLGAGAGALVSKFFKIKGTNQDKLIAAGSGAAIGATFNAPIAGTIFVLEELIQKFIPSVLFPVLIATVSASALTRYFIGNYPSFEIPKIITPITAQNLPIFIILGIMAGLLGVLFAKVVFWNNKFFKKINKKTPWLNPAIAGFMVGIIGIFIPFILGSGNLSVDLLLQHKFSIIAIAVIFITKFLITPFCFGSGAAGGIFLPILMLGSFLGYLVGFISNNTGVFIDPTLIALVGMGAFLSAVARTPITAVVMVFEMTGDYNHILPIMLSAAIADLIAEKLNHAPIYDALIFQNNKTNLSNIKVKEAMTKNITALKKDDTIQKAIDLINNTHYHILPILSKNKFLLGNITKMDLEDFLIQGKPSKTKIETIMNPNPPIITEKKDLYEALYKLHCQNVEALIVIDEKNQIKGILTRQNINLALKTNTKAILL
ncbi:MAG: chloride channel protein [Candidatus Gastranaerophilales bacterium]|nr:chloride channel protein [Candidatus Gastranaerophilales bacterium]